MKLIVAILGFINGGYMLADGVFVLLKGKYIGPEKPGPWANIFYRFSIDPFKLGPLFIIFGLAWLVFVWGFLNGQPWCYALGLTLCIATLWYLPFGTLVSIIVLALLFFLKQKAEI